MTLLEQIDLLIVADGQIPSGKHLKKYAHYPCWATDGAAWSLYDQGIVPQAIIGDLDSLHSKAKARKLSVDHCFPNVKILGSTDQDTTDFDKVISHCQALNHRALVLGSFGGAVDHSLYNLNRLQSPTITLAYHGLNEDLGQWIIPLRGPLSACVPPETTISILPMPDITITTSGLKWPLRQQRLTWQQPSLRNRPLDDFFELTIHEGKGLLVVETANTWDTPGNIRCNCNKL